MKATLFKRAFTVALLPLIAISGVLAQDHPQDVHDLSADLSRELLKEWVLPGQSSIGGGSGGSTLGTIRVRKFATDKPYLEVLKFYDSKFGPSRDDEWLVKATDFNFGGGTSGPQNGMHTIDNRPDALSSTFVYLYPHFTITVTLYHSRQDPKTHVTVTRIDRKTTSSRNIRQDLAVVEAVLNDLLTEIARKRKTDDVKLVLDRGGYETFRPKNKRIIIGNLKRIDEEFRQIEKRPEYMLERDQSYYREAMEKAFPGCQYWVTAERPEYTSDGTAVVLFHIGPAPHGPGEGIYTVVKQRGIWQVTNRSLWYPQ